MHKNLALKNSFVFALAAVICFVVLTTGVLAVHDSIVTITPNIANCNELGNTFTVNVKNADYPTSIDDIFEVRIYDDSYTETYGIVTFACGPAPTGWQLYNHAIKGSPDYYGYCEYKTQQFGAYVIEPGENVDFKFDAVIFEENCYSRFLISTLDNVLPVGEHEYHTPEVKIDCTPPTISKDVGLPKIPGVGFDWWVTQNSLIQLTSTDSNDIDNPQTPTNESCNLGLNYCQYRITVDGNQGNWIQVMNGETLNWNFTFKEDSNHYLEVECYDVAKNKAILTEMDKVDNTPPVTTKVISDPKKIDGLVEWVDTVTTITLNPVDPDPTTYSCNVGVDKTWYMNVIDLTERACWDPANYCKPLDFQVPCADECMNNCQAECDKVVPRTDLKWYDCVETCAYRQCELDPLWKLYRGVPISKPEESCHVLQFFSVDNIGNVEDMNTNCFFVDKTPPIPSKVIGDPTYGGCPKNIAPESCDGWACLNGLTKDFFVTGRYGNQVNLAQTWELAIWENTTSGEFVRADDGSDPNSYDWESDVEIDFSLSYNHADGKVTYTVGGKTLEWNYQTDKAFNYIIPFAKGDTNGNSVDLTEMELNGMALPDVNSGTGYKGLKVFLSDQDQLNGFTITGKAKLTWSKSPANEKPAFHIFAMNTHDPEDCWVRDDKTGTPGTPITLSCTDQQPHPSGDEEVCYKVSLDDNDVSAQYCSEGLETITQQGYEGDWCCVPSPKVIKFVEDSNHDLQYFCRDAVDKKSTIDLEYFKVDSVPPTITKTMIGTDHLGECPPGPTPTEPCYVRDDGKNGVHVAVQDGGAICAVDKVQCDYNLWWLTDETTCKANPKYVWSGSQCLVAGASFGQDGIDIYFHEDSTHHLYLNCQDALGNKMPTDIEEFLVDSTPPVTTKTYGGPTVVNGNYRWITSATPITLTAKDAKVGVDDVFYRVTPLYIPDESCSEWCNYAGSDKWNEIEDDHTTFTITQDSCHLIEFYSVDKLGNTELRNKQCVFVDNEKPATTKVVGEPSVVIGDKTYISQATPIEMRCADKQPHPVDQVTMKYRYRFAETCEGLPEATWSELMTYDGAIHFTEDSCHELEYYCVDALGNEETHQFEIDVVDTKSPVITTEIQGPKAGTCPQTDAKAAECFIDGVTNILVTATDQEPHPVNEVTCNWSYTVDGGNPIVGGTELTSPFVVHFPEESHHVLTITCSDALGNSASKTEYYSVDKTPPVTTKTYGTPYFEDQSGEWITSVTPITLSVEDAGPHQSGIKETNYRVTLVDDKYCYNEEKNAYPCSAATSSGEWTEYEGQFTIGETSCHLIEYYSVDNVDKTEVTKKQCVFVDNSAPTPDKTVGEPKAAWDGTDSYFYPWIKGKCWNESSAVSIDCWKVTMKTPITLNCTDPEPHPVDNEQVCFNVELDGVDATENYCRDYCDVPPRLSELDGDGLPCMKDGYCCIQGPRTFTFKEETEHNLKFYCIDALGNKNSIIDEEKFKVEGTPFEIPLQKKWNLISVPFVLLDDAPEEVFKDLTGVDSVWAWDSKKNEWLVYTPGSAPDTLNHIEPGWGYWVMELNNEKEWEQGWASEWLTIGGSLMSPKTVPPSRDLVKGWNLIGFYGTRWQLYPWSDANFQCGDAFNFPDKYIYGDKLYCSLNSLVDTQQGFPKWSSVWSFLNCGQHETFWLPLNTCPEDNNYQECMSRLYAGRGYWIELDEDDLYAPATTCIWNNNWNCVSNFGGLVA